MSNPYPIFSLQDVHPYFNDTAYTNNAEEMSKALKFRKQKQDYENYIRNKVVTGLSVVGGGLQWLPHPAAKIIGGLMQLPDMYYDGKAIVENPNAVNIGHGVLDVLNFVPGMTKIADDDVLKLPGMMDDAYNHVYDRDFIEDLNKGVNTLINKTDGFIGATGIGRLFNNRKTIKGKNKIRSIENNRSIGTGGLIIL